MLLARHCTARGNAEVLSLQKAASMPGSVMAEGANVATSYCGIVDFLLSSMPQID